MGHKHSAEEMLDAAVAVAMDEGLSRLSFGRVAKRLGLSDRTVVYYFPTKQDLVGEVVASLGLRLQETLGPAFAEPARDHLDLVRTAWPMLAHPDADPVFACFFEANGLAAAGHEPYVTLVPALVDAWVDWMATLLGGSPADQRAEAEAALALVDGLLLLRQLGGAEAADRAARRLRVR